MLIKDLDFYINQDGNYVFTEKYHLQRGHCCKNECKHCPWKFKKINKLDSSQKKYEVRR